MFTKVKNGIIPVISLLLISGITYYSYTNKIEFEQTADRLMNTFAYNEYVQKHKFVFKDIQNVDIVLELAPSFSQLHQARQYAILDLWYKNLQYGLQLKKFNLFGMEDKFFTIKATSNGKTFEFSQMAKSSKRLNSREVALIIDGEKAITKNDLIEKIKTTIIETKEKTTIDPEDIDIIQYMAKIFNIMTKKGTDYNAKIDNPLIVEATMKHFNISKEKIHSVYSQFFSFPEIGWDSK
ncbi:hypothetical protein [Bacillus sp. 1P06AnD]|uniref:hypothetical protein n=1 Tax=Bacillus sp. 1P06AnD TaxID=3132208 RepID=UPI0039A09787